MSCTSDQLGILSTPANFNSWKANYTASLNTYAAQTVEPSSTQQTSLTGIMNDIANMNLCLQSQVRSRTALPNTIYSSQQQVTDLKEQIKLEEENVSIARDRVRYIRHPEQNVSNYESWFPIDRPIHTFSLLIIMSITVFLGTFILLLILSFCGIDIIFYTETTTQYTGESWIYDQISPLNIGLLIALISVVIYFMKR